MINFSNQEEKLTPIKVAVGNWKPFVADNYEGYGQTSEKVTRVLNEMGYQPVYYFMPWGKAEDFVAKNENDNNNDYRITFPYRRTQIREKKFLFSDKPILQKCFAFFYHSSKIGENQPLKVSEINQLKRYKFGYVSEEGGYEYPDQINNILTSQDNKYSNNYQAFKKLADGMDKKVQIVPEVYEVGRELLYEFFPETYSTEIDVVQGQNGDNFCGKKSQLKSNFYVMFSKSNPHNNEFKEKFDKAFEDLDSLNEIERIELKASERATLATPHVSLDFADNCKNIIGYDRRDHKYQLHRGTKGLLKEWNDFQFSVTELKANQTSKIKILNGPHRGKELNINTECVILD